MVTGNVDLLAKQMRLTASDVRGCIQSHFGTGGERYAVLFEVRNGTAWRANRSVDAVVMSLWPSLGMELWGMEIKVSRSDWLNELKDPGKASEMFERFDRWYLVAPEHIVKIGELPPTWGWFIPEKGKLRVAREAAKNKKPKPIDRHFLAALMRRTAKTDDGFIDTMISEAVTAERARQNEEIERRAMQKMGDLRGDAENWRKVIELLKDKPKDYIFEPPVIEAIRILVKSGVASTYSSLLTMLNEIDRTKDKLETIRADLGIKKQK
jgi:hypothetical protein